MRIHYFEMGQWPLYVGFTQSPEAFRREMRRLKIEDAPDFVASSLAGATTHTFERPGATTCIITLKASEEHSAAQVAALIAHEAVHVAQQLWLAIGETAPGREAEAYLVQHVTQACLVAIEKDKADAA